MAEFKKNESLTVSLFPMFNILVCTIGVLIFIMSTISVLSLGRGRTLKIVKEELKGEHDKLPHHFVWDGLCLISIEHNDTVFFDKDITAFEDAQQSKTYFEELLKGTKSGDLIQTIIGNKETEYIVVFVREMGFKSFSSFKEFVKSEGIDIGYEPMDNYSKIKL